MYCLASKLPLAVDIWNEIEEELKTGLKGILSVDFCYMAVYKQTFIVIKHRTTNGPKDEIISLDSERLVLRLCKRFNIPDYSLNRLNFTLIPGEFPNFIVSLYPYVNDPSTLDTEKSRMNPLTID